MAEIHILLLTKAYSKYDLTFWCDFHRKSFPGLHLHVIDNDSPIDVLSCISHVDSYTCIHGFPDQYDLYSKFMNHASQYGIKDGDYVITIDDDEFLYWDNEKRLGDVLDTFSGESVFVVPQIPMSTKDLLVDRDYRDPLYKTHTYKRSKDTATTVKTIVKWKPGVTYDYKAPDRVGVFGHVPGINGSDYIDCIVPHIFRDETSRFYRIYNSEFACVDDNYLNSCLRLYHYHIKSMRDWDLKVSRGSAATHKPWYSDKIEENIFYSGYDTIDNSMRDLAERLANGKRREI